MKYRNKPIVIEAVQFLGYPHKDPACVLRRNEDDWPYVLDKDGDTLYLYHGDWIIVDGKVIVAVGPIFLRKLTNL